MRVNKTIKGEKYVFYLQFIPHSMTAKVRYFQSDEWIICSITPDFKYILMLENNKIINKLLVKKLTLNKYLQNDAKSYNGK